MEAIDRVCATVAALRAPDGCPWDREQTHQSLRRCLIDETCELLETLDNGDMPHLREELGDVLLQVLLHAQIASESGHFSLAEVADDLNAKLVRRHPHVFGEEARATDSQAVLKRWDEIKAAEKSARPLPDSPFKALPPTLPALIFADHLLKQVAKLGLSAAERFPAVLQSNTTPTLTASEAGRQLLSVVAACRQAGLDPETALRVEAQRLQHAATALWQSRQPNEVASPDRQ